MENLLIMLVSPANECPSGGRAGMLLPFRTVAIKPTSGPVSSFEQGWAFDKAGRFDEALAAYRENLAGYKPAAASGVNAGTILYNRQEYREALSYYEKALQIDHTHALAHFDIAICHEALNQNKEAVFHYQQALKYAPGYADAHFNLGLRLGSDCLSSPERKHKGEAVRHFMEYARLDPNSDATRSARAALRYLQENIGIAQKGPASQKADDFEDWEDSLVSGGCRSFRIAQNIID